MTNEFLFHPAARGPFAALSKCRRTLLREIHVMPEAKGETRFSSLLRIGHCRGYSQSHCGVKSCIDGSLSYRAYLRLRKKTLEFRNGNFYGTDRIPFREEP